MEVADVEETTRDRYEDLIRLTIVPTFGNFKLDAEPLDRFYASLHRCQHRCPSPPPKDQYTGR